MSSSLDEKITKLLGKIGYFDLELQNKMKLQNDTVSYEYFGYIDAEVRIRVILDGKHVEVSDCYLDENNYVQSEKITIGDLMRQY